MYRHNDPDGYQWRDVETEHMIAKNCAAHGNLAAARCHERVAAHRHRDHEIEEALTRAMMGDARGAQAHMNAARWDQRHEDAMRSRPMPAYHAEVELCPCTIL